MPKLIHHEEIEYDMALTYRRDTNPFKVGEIIDGGEPDDNGHSFCGQAFVIYMETNWRFGRLIPEHNIYLKFNYNPGILPHHG